MVPYNVSREPNLSFLKVFGHFRVALLKPVSVEESVLSSLEVSDRSQVEDFSPVSVLQSFWCEGFNPVSILCSSMSSVEVLCL